MRWAVAALVVVDGLGVIEVDGTIVVDLNGSGLTTMRGFRSSLTLCALAKSISSSGDISVSTEIVCSWELCIRFPPRIELVTSIFESETSFSSTSLENSIFGVNSISFGDFIGATVAFVVVVGVGEGAGALLVVASV